MLLLVLFAELIPPALAIDRKSRVFARYTWAV
jgi:hypothetical protein